MNIKVLFIILLLSLSPASAKEGNFYIHFGHGYTVWHTDRVTDSDVSKLGFGWEKQLPYNFSVDLNAQHTSEFSLHNDGREDYSILFKYTF